MWPVVYDFGIIQILGFEFHLAIYSYGLMLVVAFYTCYALLFKDMKRLNYDENIASEKKIISADKSFACFDININSTLLKSVPAV